MNAFWKFVVVGVLATWGTSAFAAGYVWTTDATGAYGGTGAPWNAYEQDGKWVTAGTNNTFNAGAAITSTDGPLTVSGTGTQLTVSGSQLVINGGGLLTVENASVTQNHTGSASEFRIGSGGSTGTVILKNGSLKFSPAANANIFVGSDNPGSTGYITSYGNSSITTGNLYVGVQGRAATTSELSVENGTLSVNSGLYIGGFNWGYNEGVGITTVKSGATLAVTKDSCVGHTGTGTMNILGTATLGGNLLVGNYMTEGTPVVYHHGIGTLNVHSGGSLTVTGTTTLGHADNTQTQTVTIDGTATLKGKTTVNRTNITVGGTLNTAALDLLKTSQTTVRGNLNTTGALQLADSAKLTIAQGGVVNTGNSEIRLNSNAATVDVYGHLTTDNQINFLCGVMKVQNGGTVQFQGNSSGYSRVGNSEGKIGSLYVYAGGTVMDYAQETMVARANDTQGSICIDGGTYWAENTNTGRGILTVGGHSGDSSVGVTASLDVINGGTLKVNTLYIGSVGTGSTITGTFGNLNTDKISTISAKVKGMNLGHHYASTLDVNYADVDLPVLSVRNNSTLNIHGGADIDVTGTFDVTAGSTANFTANVLGMGNLTAGTLTVGGAIHLGVVGAAPMNAKTYTIYNGPTANFNVTSDGMWAVTKNANDVSVTLDDANKIGNYAMGTAPLNFEDATSGWVQLDGFTTDRYELTFATSDLTNQQSIDFLEWLNGFYDGSDVKATALDDTTYQITGLRNLADTTYFAWDFTGFDGATVAMNALSGQSVPEPATWLLGILALGMLRGWRRKP